MNERSDPDTGRACPDGTPPASPPPVTTAPQSAPRPTAPAGPGTRAGAGTPDAPSGSGRQAEPADLAAPAAPADPAAPAGEAAAGQSAAGEATAGKPATGEADGTVTGKAGGKSATVRTGPLLLVLLSAVFMAQFDFFVVNVAAPSLGRELRAGPVALEMIVGGYAFTYASGMITGGRLGDLYGYRRIFLAGTTGFTVASLLCGLALTPGQLIAARLLQGLGAAVMVPQVLASFTAVLPAGARSRAFGWYGAAGGLGSIAGQVLGGALVQADFLGLGWRTVFLVNVPVGVGTLLAAHRVLPRTGHRAGAARLDLRGAVGVALALALLLVPLALGRTEGWPAWTWVSMALAVAVGALTVRWQRVLRRRGGAPVLELSLLREPGYRSGIAAAAVFMAYFASFMFTLTLLLQDGLGLNAQEAGLVFTAPGVAFACSSLAGRHLVGRWGLRAVQAGAALTLLGLLALAVLVSATRGQTVPGGLPALMAVLGVASLGNGLVLPQLLGASLRRVAGERAGIGSAMLTTAQQFGGAAGVTVVGGVFFALAPQGAGAAMAGATWLNAGLVAGVALLVTVIRGQARRARDERPAR
ncbi:MFS transporter [Streptomyces albus]|uniref:MFS transporter n=1 Tax=Streptomyces albus TaxID=1888 RepID=UPI0036FAE181